MKRTHYAVIAAIVIILDAWTKWLVTRSIQLHDAIPVIPNLFQIVHVRNTGAAFGIGANADSRIVP
ncbi:MAG: signal peptidase II, partial [Thermoanaerobaculia bacterium]|nr:signal peptidase II [Thermoanaerobaculia bacterium]